MGLQRSFAVVYLPQKKKAEDFIAQHQLSGILTRYPLDTGVYDWAIAEGIFKPSRDYQLSPRFISRFTSASHEHFHYEMGREGSEDDNSAGRPDVRDQ
ncbi:hypothetical protein [Gimesia chilikensis]|uniref:DUF7710 domain-containing protein n=1 Tax=Gimesia chilikensis TaxID=2605989 RepID=UPI00118C3E9B|nr:hypothetical protein [Gimesia chilikensis]QDT87158.1 hypothetical protein MalM14_48430 [Gimesia chilikensis]